jgi:hypothetical protein
VGTFVALVVGYALGAKTKGKGLDRLSASLKSLFETDEFAEVVAAARFQVGSHLRAVADIVEGETLAANADEEEDLVERVTRLMRPR